MGLGGPVAGVIAAASGPLIEEISFAAREAISRRQARVLQAVQAAVEVEGVEVKTILNRALEDDLKLELLARTLNGAASSVVDGRIDALGRALARGVLAEDVATVEDELYLSRALSELEPADVRLLVVLPPYREGRKGIEPDGIRDQQPGLGPVLDALLAKMMSLGLVSDASYGGMTFGVGYWITELGLRCLRELRKRGESTAD